MTTSAPSTSTYVLISGDSVDLPNSRVLAVDQGLGLNDNGTFITITPEDTLGALQDLPGTGLISLTGANTAATRNITSGGSISITNPGGISGNIIIDQIASTSLQLVNILASNSSVGNTSKLNLIAGPGAGVSCVTNGDRIDCTFTATSDASINAPYWVSTNTTALPQQVNMGALTSGLLKIGVSAGTATPATATAGTDYYAPGFPTYLVEQFNSLYIGTNTMTAGSSFNGNVVIGTGAGQNSTVSDITIIGYHAAQNLTTFNAATAIGYQAMMSATNGATATAIGASALSTATACGGTVAIGYNAASARAVYGNCVFLGNGADASVSGLTNGIAIGTGALVGTNNTMVLGSAGTTVVIGGNASSGYASLELNPSTGTASLWMGTNNSPTVPVSGGVFSVSTGNNAFFTSGTTANSGQIVTAVNASAIVGQAQSLLVGNGNNYSCLVKGSANQALKMDGTGTNIIWTTDSGSTVYSGQATLTAGTVTVSNANVATGSIIALTYGATPSNPGILSVGTITNATSFVINSTNALDNGTINWHFI